MLGLILFAVTIVAFRDYRKLEQYRYVIVAMSLGLLILPRLPGIGYQANGAYLGVRIPGLFVFQPTEFAKVGLVIFLASYLRDTRQVMVIGARRFLGITIPPIKYFGPVLVIWGVAMVIMLLLHDIGSSLMFYGGAAGDAVRGHRPALVRGRRAGWRSRSAPGTSGPTSRTCTTASTRGCTRSTRSSTTRSAAATSSPNSMFAQAAGGMFGQGFGAGDAHHAQRRRRCCRRRRPT